MNDVQPIPMPDDTLNTEENTLHKDDIPILEDTIGLAQPVPAGGAPDIDAVPDTVEQQESITKKKGGAVKRVIKHIFMFLFLVAMCALFACGGFILGSKKATVEKLMNISFDSSALFTKVSEALLNGTESPRSFELSTDIVNNALHSSSSAFQNLSVRIGEDGLVNINGNMQTAVLKTETATLPAFLFNVLPETTDVNVVAQVGFTDGKCTVNIKSAEMFGAALDEDSINGFGLGNIAQDYINEQISLNVPENVTLNNIKTENGKLYIDLTF